MEMEGEAGGCLTSENVDLRWKESLPIPAAMGGQGSRTSPRGQWAMRGACSCEANLTHRLLLFPLAVLAGPATRWNPRKARGRRYVRCLGKGKKRGPRGPWACGVSWEEVCG